MSNIKLVSSIKSFSKKVRQLSREFESLPLDVQEEKTEALYKSFQRLHKKYGGLADSIIEELPPDEQRLVRYFELGRSEQVRFIRPFLAGLANSDSGKQAEIFMAEFIKTDKCRWTTRSSRLTDMSKEEVEELKELLGGMLGIEITDGFIHSIRHELITDLLGYAISGLSDIDVKRFQRDEGVRKNHDTIHEYLRHRMISQKLHAKYNYLVEDGVAKTAFAEWSSYPLEEQARLLKNEETKNRNAPARTIDSSFINEANHSITLCMSTANGVVGGQEQAGAMAKAYEALLNWLDSDDCHLKDKEKYKDNIKIIILNGGLMPTNNPQPRGPAKTHEGKSMLVSMGEESWDKDFRKEVLDAVAMTSYISYFADKMAGPKVAAIMLISNYFCLGSDTEGLWSEKLNLIELSKKPTEKRAVALDILNRVASITSVLSDDRVDLSIRERDGKGILLNILKTCSEVMEHHFLNFPLDEKERLTKKEVELLEGIGADMVNISEKLRSKNTTELNGDLISKTRLVGLDLSDRRDIEKKVELGRWHNAGKVLESRHDKELQLELSGGMSPQRRQEMVDTVHDLLVRTWEAGYAPPLLEVLKISMGLEPATEKLRKFAEIHSDLAETIKECKVDGTWNNNTAREYFVKWRRLIKENGDEVKLYGSLTSFNSTKAALRRDLFENCPKTMELIEKSSFLTDSIATEERVSRSMEGLAEVMVDIIGNKRNHPILSEMREWAGPKPAKRGMGR